MQNNFKRSFTDYNKDLAKQDDEISGELGIYLNGEKLVEVPNRNGYVYVRLRNSLNEVIQAFNDSVSAAYNLPVIVVRDGTKYRIKGRDTNRYNDWGTSAPYLPIHGNQHSFNPDAGGGGDPVWVYGKQFMPLNVIPSGTYGATNVIVSVDYPYRNLDGSWSLLKATGTENIVQYKPTDNQAIMGIVYFNPDTQVPEFMLNSGTFFSASLTGTSEILPYLPGFSNNSYLPLYGVRLVSGTSVILWENLYDIRQYFTPPSSGTASLSGMGGGIVIQSDGGFLVTGTSLNFVGTNVTVSASGTNALVQIEEGLSSILIYEDGSFKASGTAISFNSNLNVLVSGSVVYIDAEGGGAGGGGIMGQDEGTPLGTGTTMNFVGDGVTATISGSVLNVSIPGGGGGELEYVEFLGRTVTATSESTPDWIVSGSSMSYDGSTTVLIEFYSPYVRPTQTANATIDIYLMEDGASVGKIALIQTPATNSDFKPVFIPIRRTPASGNHFYGIAADVSSGSGFVGGATGGFGVIVPGYMRIVTA